MSTANNIISNQSLTTSGFGIHKSEIGQEITLFCNILGPIDGTSPTIQFTLQ
jgi:hypothetical protein